MTALDASDFDLARSKLREAADIDRDAVKELAERARTRALSAADSLRESARASRIGLHYRDAAKDLNEAAELVERFDREAAWNLRIAQASDLYAQGDEFGDNDALTEAISVYRSGLLLAPRLQHPLDWAMTQMGLGAALQALGERESGTARLEEAVAAYRAALGEQTRARAPLDWARTQTNLGNALATLGERESGTARLEEAVAAYRAALEEGTRARVPLQWATSTGSQGVTLRLLAERRSDLAVAEQALGQITAAFETLRDAHHAPNAAYYEAQLPSARALVERLRKE